MVLVEYHDEQALHGTHTKTKQVDIGLVALQALDYLRLSVWQDGSKYKKQQMQDVLNV